MLDEEPWVRLASENANVGLWTSDLQTLRIRFSSGWKRVLGRDPAELALADLWALVHPDDRARSTSAIQEHLQGRTGVYEVEQRMLHADGSYRWVLSRGIVVSDATGRPRRLIGADIDITVRKETTDRLHDADTRYRTLFDSMDAAVLLLDGDRCIDCNPATLTLFGLERQDEIVGKTPLEFAPAVQPDGRSSADAVREHLEAALAGGTRVFEWQAVRPSGETFVMEVRLTPFQGGGKALFQCIALDITRRKELENALRESRNAYRELVEGINDVIYAVDERGRVTYISPAAERVFGVVPAQVIAQHFSDFIFPDDLPEVASWFHDALAGRPEAHDHRIMTSSGTVRWVRNHSHPMHEGGRVIGLRGVLSDITERKRLEAEIAAANQSLEARVAERTRELAAAAERMRLQGAALESAADSIVITDAEGRITWVNPAFTETTGYCRDEALSQTIGLLRSDLNDEAVVAELWRTVRSGRVHRGEIVYRRKNGGQYTAEIVVAPVRNASGELTHFVEVQHDVTARRAAERRVRRSEGQLQAIIAAEPECVKVVAADGTLVDMNPAGLAMIEADSLDQVRGRVIGDLVVDRYREAFRTLAGRACDGQEGTLELEIVGLKGTHRWVDTHVVPLPGGPGEPTMALSITRDITARKHAEQRTAALLEITTEIAGTLDRSELLDGVQRRVAEFLPCEAVITYLLDPARSSLRVASHHGIPDGVLPILLARRFMASEAFGEDVARGAPLVVDDPAASAILADVVADLPAGPLAAVRLSVHGQYFGRLCAVRARGKAPFTPAQVELLGGIGRQTAIGLRAVELYEAQRTEADVSGRLAHLGQQLIAHLNAPDLLDRLCGLTMEILGCEGSVTLFRDPRRHEWTTVATFGRSSELWESLRAMTMADLPLSPVTQELERIGLLELDGSAFSMLATPTSALALEAAVSRAVLVALRRGTELAGAQVAIWYGPREPLTGDDERLARGIGQMASIVLDHVRVMQELGRANRLKSDFMATMSHELRTPLNIIIGYDEMLLEDAFGPLSPEQTDAVRRIRRSASELLDLVNATLDVGRLESGASPLKLEYIDVAGLLCAVEAETADRCQKPAVALEWEAPAQPVRIRSDVAKLKMILKNLLHNAMKFTRKGRIVVRADQVEGGLDLVVADTGIGMAPELIATIFEPFRQGDGESASENDGVGLGLYIVSQLVDLLGFTVTVESEVARGSIFRVRIPADFVVQDPGSRGAAERT